MSRVYRVNINFTQTGSVSAARSIQQISTAANGAAHSVFQLKTILSSIISVVVIRQIAELADESTSLQNRLLLVTASAEDMEHAFDRIGEVANKTRTSIRSTGQTFSRFALGIQNLNINKSQEELFQVVENINKAVILSGSNFRETEAALLQFSQGLASNRLAGDELRAVLEQLPLVADIVAKKLGVTRGALRFLAKEGEIDAKLIIDAFQDLGPDLERKFKNSVPTIGQSFVVFRNQFEILLEKMDDSTGVFGKVARSVLFLAQNMETLVRATLAITAALSSYVVVVTTIAVLTSPFTALIASISLGASLLVFFSDKIQLGIDKFTTLQDLLTVFWNDLKSVAIPVIRNLFGMVADESGKLNITAADVVRGIAMAIDAAINAFKGLYLGLNAAWKVVFGDMERGAAIFYNLVATIIEKPTNLAIGAAKAIHYVWTNTMRSLGEAAVGLLKPIASISQALMNLQTGNISAALQNIDDAKKQLLAVPADLGMDLMGVAAGAYQTMVNELGVKFIPRAKLKFAEGGKDAAEAFSDAFNKELEGNRAMKYVEGALSRAQELAKKARENKVLRSFREGGVFKEEDQVGSSNLKGVQQVVYERYLNTLQGEVDALGASNRERRIREDLLRADNKLRSQGVVLNEEQFAEVDYLIRKKNALEDVLKTTERYADVLPKTSVGFSNLQAVRDNGNEEIEAILDLYDRGIITIEEYNDLTDSLINKIERQTQVYSDIKDPLYNYEDQLRAINEVSKLVLTSVEKMNLELAKTKARIELLQDDRSMYGGMERGFLRLQQLYTNTGLLVEDSLVTAFRNGEDALVDFITTGKNGFRELALSIGQDLVRLGIRRFITGNIANFLGESAGGGNLLPFFGGGLAAGGDALPGVSYVVGEEGPERLDMGASGGRVTPLGRRSGGGGTVNVTNLKMVVNTPNPDAFRRSEAQVLGGAGRKLRRMR